MLGMPIDEPINNMGFNYSSPTVNNVMGGMYGIPPNPIGSTLNVGGYGYNPYMAQQTMYQQPMPMNNGMMGGYYGGYNLNMNPYLYQQQLAAQEAAYKEQLRQQSDIMKSLSTTVHKGLGDIDNYENFEAHLEQYDPVMIDNDAYQEELHYNKLCNLQPIQPNYAYLAHCAKVREENKRRFPDTMGLADYLDNAGELYLEALTEKAKARNRNGKLQYDTDQYKKILESHRSSNSYFNSLLTGGMSSSSINIDDMEIQLPSDPEDKTKIVITAPSHMQEYAARKQAFLNEILKNASTL